MLSITFPLSRDHELIIFFLSFSRDNGIIYLVILRKQDNLLGGNNFIRFLRVDHNIHTLLCGFHRKTYELFNEFCFPYSD